MQTTTNAEPVRGSDVGTLRRLLDELTERHGRLDGWWPAASRFEVMIGSILTQRTRWENAAASLERLRGAGLLSDPNLLVGATRISDETLVDLIRPSGFVRAKSRACRAVATWVCRVGAADALLASPLDRAAGGPPTTLPALADVDSDQLRGDLLTVHGVGPETADAQLLFAFDRPTFIADAYTHQVFSARGLVAPDGYMPMRALWQPRLQEEGFNAAEAQRLHALLVEEGSELR